MLNQKYTFIAALLAAGSVASVALAQYTGPSAVNTPTTVKQILDNPREDQYVRLEGKLIRKLSADAYTFQDATGTIEVEIEPEIFPKTAVNENTVVILMGEIDRRLTKAPEVEVESITLK